VAVQMPTWVAHLPPVQRVWRSWLFQLVWWYFVKPLIITLAIWLFLPASVQTLLSLGVVLAIAVAILNSRIGHAASEVIAQGILQLYDKLRSGLIEGVIRWIMYVLKAGMDALERLLYSIDEWLRFRSGDTRASLAARTALGIIWYPIAFF